MGQWWYFSNGFLCGDLTAKDIFLWLIGNGVVFDNLIAKDIFLWLVGNGFVCDNLTALGFLLWLVRRFVCKDSAASKCLGHLAVGCQKWLLWISCHNLSDVWCFDCQRYLATIWQKRVCVLWLDCPGRLAITCQRRVWVLRFYNLSEEVLQVLAGSRWIFVSLIWRGDESKTAITRNKKHKRNMHKKWM